MVDGEQIRMRFLFAFGTGVWYNNHMSDSRGRIPRGAMSQQERQWRSKLAQICSGHGLIRGSLVDRERLCGKPNCKCTRGHKHRSLYLVLVKAGKTHQLYVPRQLEAKVRQWVRNYHAIRDLMDQVSQIHWDKVRTRQG
jgi:hypothetical protein